MYAGNPPLDGLVCGGSTVWPPPLDGLAAADSDRRRFR
jgi:hypothetical protein